MPKIDNCLYDYDRLTSIGYLTKFEDIKVGETYHIPPLIIYDRRDFTVERKDWNTVRGKMVHADGSCTTATLYKTELSIRYLVKKQSINKI